MWLEALVDWAHDQIDERCREELLGRGVSPEQMESFRLGYFSGARPPLDLPDDFVEWANIGRHVQDVFVLPLTNTLGQVKGIQVRSVDRSAKNYQEFAIPTGEPYLFGLGQAAEAIWHTEEIVLVEGVFDLFPIQRSVPQTVATLTAKVPENFLPTMRRVVRCAWLGYDMDHTGWRGVSRFRKQHGDEFDIHRLEFPGVRLPNGKAAKDPGDVWEAWGDDRLYQHLSNLMWLTTRRPEHA